MLCIGIIITIQGVVGLIFASIGNFSAFGMVPFIFPLVALCVGPILLIIGLGFIAKANKMADKEFTDYRPIRRKTIRWTTKKSPLTCPSCRAPLPKRPPCVCEYCGTHIE